VKQLVSAALMAALVAACSALTAEAQAPAPPRTPVAIIDLSYVFKNYSKFIQLTESMKRKVETADTALKGRQEELKATGRQLEEMQLGSPNRNQLEEQFTKMQADIQVEIATQRKDFLRQEAQIYYTVYQEVQDASKSHCERNGILLVMRFNGDEIDPNNPQEVMQDLNKAVVYHNRAIDITPAILQYLESTVPNAATTGGARPPAAGPTNRQAPPPRTGARQGVPPRQ
jgi:Skp family chaperone for outer membrane proteins